MACCMNLCTVQEQDDIMSKPLRDRRITDKCCLLFMIFFAGVTFSFTLFGFLTGTPARYLNGFDSYGNVCGSLNPPLPDFPLSGQDLRNRTNVLWMIAHNFSKSPQICVGMCPDEELKTKQDILAFYKRTNVSLCRYDFIIKPDSPDPISEDFCAKTPLPKMQAVVNRCMPQYVVQSAQSLVLAFYAFFADTEWIKRSIASLIAGKYVIAIMFGSSFGLSYLMVFLLHFFAVAIAKALIWLFFTSTILVSLSLWFAYLSIIFEFDDIRDYIWGDKLEGSESILLTVACVFTVIALLFCWVLCVMRKHVDLVVALFLETARCFRTIPCLLCSPIQTIIITVLFVAYWLVTFTFVISSSAFRQVNYMNSTGDDASYMVYDMSGNGTDPSAYGRWVRFTLNPWVNVIIGYLVFLLFWGSEFIIGCQKAVISGTVAAWYFTKERDKLATPMLAAYQIITRKHLGTIGLGSFLVVLVVMIRILIKLRVVVAGGAKSNEKKELRLILQLLDCILEKIERLIRFINYNAYTVMAIEGTNFCDSGFKAAGLMVENFAKVLTINTVGDFILWLGKMAVALVCLLIGLFLLKGEDKGFLVFPMIVGFFLSFLVADCVLSVYEMIIDSLFLCYCHDRRINEHTGRFYAPPSLMSLIKKTHGENLYPSTPEGDEARRSSEQKKEAEGGKPTMHAKKEHQPKKGDKIEKKHSKEVRKSEEENKNLESAKQDDKKENGPIQKSKEIKSNEVPKSKETT
ncbi:choline transporter-like protein 1 [Brevipalpus obovatus]|uniref:choline transporter-like protein 1 n=1 Tax=Brevipalpus obovatus TaxID=246614 RepID=UPI003D9DEE2E